MYVCMRTHTRLKHKPRNSNKQTIKTGNLTTYHASNIKTKQPKLTNEISKQQNMNKNKQIDKNKRDKVRPLPQTL